MALRSASTSRSTPSTPTPRPPASPPSTCATGPSARVARGRAEDVDLPQGEGARHLGAVARPGPPRHRGGRRQRPHQAGLLARRDLAVVGAGAAVRRAGAGHGRQALPLDARTAPSRRGAEAQWTSWHGEVLECAVWWGPLVATAGRTAAVCTESSTSVVTQADAADGGRAPGPRVGARHRRVALRARPRRHPGRAHRRPRRGRRRRRARHRRRLRHQRPARTSCRGPGATGSSRRCRCRRSASPGGCATTATTA